MKEKNKVLRISGFILVALGLLLFTAMLMLPEAVFMKEILPFFLVVGGLVSLGVMIIMTIPAPRDESMKCPACGREVDALIGRVNDPETKVCVDCHICGKEGLRKGEQ